MPITGEHATARSGNGRLGNGRATVLALVRRLLEIATIAFATYMVSTIRFNQKIDARLRGVERSQDALGKIMCNGLIPARARALIESCSRFPVDAELRNALRDTTR